MFLNLCRCFMDNVKKLSDQELNSSWICADNIYNPGKCIYESFYLTNHLT